MQFEDENLRSFAPQHRDDPSAYFGDIHLDTALFFDDDFVKYFKGTSEMLEQFAVAVMHQAQLYFQQVIS